MFVVFRQLWLLLFLVVIVDVVVVVAAVALGVGISVGTTGKQSIAVGGGGDVCSTIRVRPRLLLTKNARGDTRRAKWCGSGGYREEPWDVMATMNVCIVFVLPKSPGTNECVQQAVLKVSGVISVGANDMI